MIIIKQFLTSKLNKLYIAKFLNLIAKLFFIPNFTFTCVLLKVKSEFCKILQRIEIEEKKQLRYVKKVINSLWYLYDTISQGLKYSVA